MIASPNNWMAAFGGSAWTRASDDDSQWYLGTFTPQQPDFDRTTPTSRRCSPKCSSSGSIGASQDSGSTRSARSARTRNFPTRAPVPPGTGPLQVTWENPYTVFRPEGHDVWRRFRSTVDDYMDQHPGRDLMMVAEAYMNARLDLVAAFVDPEQFHQAFAFDLLLSPWEKGEIERAIVDTFAIAKADATPRWAPNNHDVQRVVTRLGRATATEPASRSNNALEVRRPGADSLDRRSCDVVRFLSASSRRPSTGRAVVAAPRVVGHLAVEQLDGADGSILELYRDVIAARREYAVPQGFGARVVHLGEGLVAVRRGPLTAITNVTRSPISVDSTADGLANATPVFASEPAEMHEPGICSSRLHDLAHRLTHRDTETPRHRDARKSGRSAERPKRRDRFAIERLTDWLRRRG